MMDDNDELLDKIILRLRSEPTPEIPEDFKLRRPMKSTRSIPYFVAVSVVAASILGYVFSHAMAPMSGKPTTNLDGGESLVKRSDVGLTVKPIDIAAPLAELEAELASIDAQVNELHKHAALLDARRQADEMLVKYGSYAGAIDAAN